MNNSLVIGMGILVILLMILPYVMENQFIRKPLAMSLMIFIKSLGKVTRSKINQYLVGDWNGDGVDNIALRRGNFVYGNLIHKDINNDSTVDLSHEY